MRGRSMGCRLARVITADLDPRMRLTQSCASTSSIRLKRGGVGVEEQVDVAGGPRRAAGDRAEQVKARDPAAMQIRFVGAQRRHYPVAIHLRLRRPVTTLLGFRWPRTLFPATSPAGPGERMPPQCRHIGNIRVKSGAWLGDRDSWLGASPCQQFQWLAAAVDHPCGPAVQACQHCFVTTC